MRLRELMKKNGYTQQSLADHIGVSRSTVGMWVTGRNEPDNGTIEKLAGLFGCSVGYLMGTENEINAQRSLDALRADFQAHTEGKLDALLNQSDFPSNVRPISALHHQRVPLIGEVAAGEPIYAPEDLGVYVESPVDADAAITVRGDSMIPTYQDGDLVYAKARPDVPEGAVAVVFLDDEATLKHVYKRPTGLTLWSDNTIYPPMNIEFDDYTNVRIFGVPVGYTRIYKPSIEGKIRKGFKQEDRK